MQEKVLLALLIWHPLRNRLIGENAPFHTSFACGLVLIVLSFDL
jgi:hypothetical protein